METERCRGASGQFESSKSVGEKRQITSMTRGPIQPQGAIANKPKHGALTKHVPDNRITRPECM